MEILTFGHGTASADTIVALLRDADVEVLVDIRTAPGSRRNPHVARDALARWLPEHGIDYRWERRLGGWRKARPDSPDVALRERAFAGYAAYMRSPEFAAAVDDLLAGAALRRTAVMCAETVWWRCHRKMLSDYLVLVRGVEVRHLLHDGRLQSHPPSDLARRRDDGLLVYDAGQQTL
ncbi:DUF488 family protein [Actinopolymorpha alba]|uniref:DUF488 domain-containing protein n=1 Tax=Actinopolymorpha alba TaxID=533267 RepID=UPI000363BD32|nr:DUF488 domain-containing protein [Actinopolymorpha alba]